LSSKLDALASFFVPLLPKPQYTLGDRPGWSFIFKSGRYDGFSPEEVNWTLEVTGEVCVEVTDYEFKSIIRLSEDFRRGRFAAAFS
jgi:hypothetical protein